MLEGSRATEGGAAGAAHDRHAKTFSQNWGNLPQSPVAAIAITLDQCALGLARARSPRGAPVRMAAKRSAAEAAASEEAPGFAARFLGYINETPTPFHLCAVTAAKLQSAGFSELSESDAWASSGSVVAGGKYFYTRCASRASTVRSVRC